MIKELNEHYSMTNPASVYDEDALTALELAGRTTAKVNEVVRDQNALRQETEKHLEEQDKDIKNQKEVVIPATVKTEVQRHIDNGDFDKAINEHAGDLEGRLNNLLGSLEEGSTTGDAELIDARIDKDGYSWENAGENIRHTQKKTNDLVTNFCTPIFTDVTKDHNNGWYDQNTNFLEHDGYRCFKIEVSEGDIYYYGGTYGYSCYGAICVDSENNILSRYFHHNTGGKEEFKTPIIIPKNGAYLYVNSQHYHDDNFYAYYYPLLFKVSKYELNSEGMTDYMNNVVSTMSNNNDYVDVGTTRTAFIMEDGRPFKGETSSLYTLFETEVKPGETYKISGQANYEKYVWVMYNTGDYPCILGVQGGQGEEGIVEVNDLILNIPTGVKYLRVAGMEGKGKLQKLVNRNANNDKMWSHLKWCCVGDSLTELNERTDLHYFDYVQSKTGISVVNMGQSGTGYKRQEDNGRAFYQRITNVPLDSNVVTIFGSGNDGGAGELGTPTDTGTDTICGCINTTLDNLYSILPTVQLGIVSPTPWSYQTPDDPDCFMYKYTEALKTICYNRGIPFLDLFRLSGFRTMKNGVVNEETHNLLFSKDPEGNNCHPNELGHKIMSSHFYNFLNSLIGTY